MRQFKHFIITRFNLGLYSPGACIRISPDEWMAHRIKLFATFTLPSVISQTCQNFTWLILMDSRTPEVYRNMIASIEYPNIHLVYADVSQEKMPLSHECFSRLVTQNITPGDYDLITTRIDNDDAFRMDTVRVIQDWYRPRPVRWTIVFAFGYLLDLSAKQIFLMQYWVNNCPTMIERSIGARSVYFTGHTRLVADAAVTIGDKPYWIQVVHSENIANVTFDSGTRTVYRDKTVNIANLSGFNIDIDIAGLQNIELQTARRK